MTATKKPPTVPETDWGHTALVFESRMTPEIAEALAFDTASDLEAIQRLHVGLCPHGPSEPPYCVPLQVSTGIIAGVACFSADGDLETVGRGLAVPDGLDYRDRTLFVAEHPADALLMTSWRQAAICAPNPVEMRLELLIACAVWKPKRIVALLSGFGSTMWDDDRLWAAFGGLKLPVRVATPHGYLNFANWASKCVSRRQAKNAIRELLGKSPSLSKKRSVALALGQLAGHGRLPDIFDFSVA